MQRSRSLATMAVALTLVTLSGGAAVLAQDTPVVLRLAVSDDEGRPSDPYVHAFIDEVARRSGGTVTLEPSWGAGGDAFEQGVAQQVVSGEADLGLAASRAWDKEGILGLQALQAPFLITDDALAMAVATSDTAATMLDGMASAGVTGLSLWPEDLRHPVAFEPCSGPLLTPADFEGLTIRLIASELSFEMIRALGATPLFVNGYDSMVQACEIQGAESGMLQGPSLPGKPTFTGDVTFYPKYQVLAANSAVFARLSEAQQLAIREAAVAARDQALSEHTPEADAAREWCDSQGKVVMAGPDAIVAFKAAVQPVFDRLRTDPITAAAITAITDLASTITPAAAAQACDPAPLPSVRPVDTTGYVGAALPIGTFRIELTEEELIVAGASKDWASDNFGTWTWTFGDGTWKLRMDGHLIEGEIPECGGTVTSVDGHVEFTTTPGGTCSWSGHFIWREDPDGLRLTPVDYASEPPQDVLDTLAFLSKPLTRIE